MYLRDSSKTPPPHPELSGEHHPSPRSMDRRPPPRHGPLAALRALHEKFPASAPALRDLLKPRP